MKFHVFYTSVVPEQIVQDHQQCCQKLGLDVEYAKTAHSDDRDKVYSQHGDFLTSTMSSSRDDVVCFLDIDCLPHDPHVLASAYEWALENGSFVGNAQNISHTRMRNHVYAAASMLMVSKEAWNSLGRPDLSWFIRGRLKGRLRRLVGGPGGDQIDTAQLLSLKADEVGLPYRLMYPIGYDEPPTWKLAGYGDYGRGTTYPGTWHYFRISELLGGPPALWSDRVAHILDGADIVPAFRSRFYG